MPFLPLSRRARVGCAVAIVALCAVAAWMCFDAVEDEQTAAAPIRAVKLARAQAAHAERSVDYAATIVARHSVPQSFRVGGKILARPVEVGQHVAAGQLLAQLDAVDLQLAAQASAAQVQAAQAAAELAQSQWRRDMQLHAEGFVSAAQLEHSTSAHQRAAAQLAQAQAQAAAQSRQSGYARLVAEGAGVVTAVSASAGQVVAPGQTVLSLALDGARDAVFAVPEAVRERLRLGAPVQLRPYNGGAALAAQVREIAASADAATRQFTVWAALDAPHTPAAALGTSWRAALLLPAQGQATSAQSGQSSARGLGQETQQSSTEGASVRIPAAALWRGADGGGHVWVFDAASASVRARRVEVGAVRGDVVLLAAGLDDGEWIVAAGTHVLSEGERVRPWSEAATQDNAPDNTQGGTR